jgi:thiamine-monophosphate kinase
MTEFELIDRLRVLMPSNASTQVGPGDDCAVLDLGLADRWLLFKTDAIVEGVHFEVNADPLWIGHKALARCLSDVAAMGGAPSHALVTLGLPRNFDAARVEGVYAGMKRLAERHGVAIAGGETTSNPERMFLSLAVIGTAGRGRCPLRSGAQPGDALFVTGELGDALESGRHLNFEPRLAEGQWLVEHFEIHAMIDLSDGLAGDLKHVLKASHVGAEILADAIPIHPAVRGASEESAEKRSYAPDSRLTKALSEGEDYELLFTLPEGESVRLLDAWQERFPNLRLSCIGKISPGSDLVVRDRDGPRPLTLDGYVHFQKP